MSAEFSFLRAVLSKRGKRDAKQHLLYLDECKEMFMQRASSEVMHIHIFIFVHIRTHIHAYKYTSATSHLKCTLVRIRLRCHHIQSFLFLKHVLVYTSSFIYLSFSSFSFIRLVQLSLCADLSLTLLSKTQTSLPCQPQNTYLTRQERLNIMCAEMHVNIELS